jgi:hypothetical protein
VARTPQASGQAVAAATPSLLANFNGTSSRDSEVTNFGQEFEPPDQGLCAGNGFVVEMVNSAYTVYKPNGTVVTGPFNVNGPFDEGLTEFTSDPLCHYDAATNTWFAVILFISADNTTSRIDLAVNTSGDQSCGPSTGSTPPTLAGRPALSIPVARASAISRCSVSTSSTSTSRPTSSRSSGRSSTALRSTPSPRAI